MRFVIYRDNAGEWRWHLVAANSRLVATSGEAFYDQHNALRAAQDIYTGVDEMPTGGDIVINTEARTLEDATKWPPV